MAPQHTVTPSSSTSGPSSAPAALEPARSRGRLPSTAPGSTTHPAASSTASWITAPGATSTSSASLAGPATNAPAEISGGTDPASLRGGVERLLQAFEHPHDAQPAFAVGSRPATLDDALHEVLALDAQRLDVGNRRRDDPTATGYVLPVAERVLVETLVVDRDLPLERHGVERRHTAPSDDREPPLLGRLEPGQMQVGGQARRETKETEHNVLDAVPDIGLAVCRGLRGLLAGQVQDHRHVVGAEAPEGVLVGPEL